MELATYAKRLAAAVAVKKESAFENLCFDVEYDQLAYENWPQEVFDFFIQALRDPKICALAGSYAFVTTLRNDFDKLTPSQRETLLSVFYENVDEFADEMLRHATSDLIARRYSVEMALKTFNEWMHVATPNRLHMSQVGLEVMVVAKRLEQADEAKVRNQLQRLWQRDQGRK